MSVAISFMDIGSFLCVERGMRLFENPPDFQNWRELLPRRA
jgi:hypothetical protein